MWSPAQQSGQVSPMDRITSSNATIQASGVAPGNWFPPRFLARPVPGVRICAIAPVPMVLAFGDRLLLHQHAEGPTLKGSISWANYRGGKPAL